MVEGMVMELYKSHVVVMTKSGEFLKLKKRGNVNIGDIYKENVYRRIPVSTYAAAAVLIFLFTSFAGYTAYANQIVGYVDIKGSKDVRLYVSRKGTVQKVDGLQNANQIKNLPVYQAVKELNTIAPAEGIYNNSSEVDVITTEVKNSKLDFKKVNEDVKRILSEENKSNGNNPNKAQPDNFSKDNNNSKPEKSNNGNDSKTNNNNANTDNNDNKDDKDKGNGKDKNTFKDSNTNNDNKNTNLNKFNKDNSSNEKNNEDKGNTKIYKKIKY